MGSNLITPNWNSPCIDEHRRGISDIAWVKKQLGGKPNYTIGDVIEFMAGGFAVIDEVSEPRNGWPSSYSVSKIKGKPFHPKAKTAWHYEGDFKRLIAESGLRTADYGA